MARAAGRRESSRDANNQHVARNLRLLAQVDLVAGGSLLEELAFGKELAELDEAGGGGGEEARGDGGRGGDGGSDGGADGAEGGAGEHCVVWFGGSVVDGGWWV